MIGNVIAYIIGIATIAFLLIRRSRRRSGAPLPPVAVDAGPPPVRLLPLPGDVGLVAAREFRERVRGRVFRAGTLLLLLAVAAVIVIPALTGGKQGVQRVGVVGALPAPLRAAVTADGPALGTTVTLVPEASRQAAVADLRAGRVAVAVVDGRQVLTDKPVTSSAATTTAQLARAVARGVGTGEAVAAAHLTPAQAGALAAARPLPLASLSPAGPGATQRNTSLAGLVLVLVMLTQYNAWTLTGVLEEKSSRVVEVLLAAIPPGRLLAGKLLGIGLAVFLQAGLAVATAIGAVRAVHSDVLHGSTPVAIAATLAWLVLGYAFYSWAYAAAGSTAERQDQVQALTFPLTLPVIFGYVVAFTAATSGGASTLLRVLAYLPPTAPLAMPALVGLGAATWWQFAVSALISVASTVVVARAATAVYRRAILQTGRRVRLRDLLPA